MVHYNVFFTLKEGVDEGTGLAVIGAFLRGLCDSGEAAGYRLLVNGSAGSKTRLPKYQAVVQFADDAALGRAMARQAALGIHSGAHGRVIDTVAEFHVEIFREAAGGG
jgi:hypothetical protein